MSHDLLQASIHEGEDGYSSELRMVGERAVEYQELHFHEPAVNHALGAAAVVGDWGIAMNPDEHLRAVDEHVRVMGREELGRSHVESGFSQTRWSKLMPYSELLPFQAEVSRRAILESCRAVGVDPSNLKRISVASTTPFSEDIANLVRASLGVSSEVPAEYVAAACNSSALAFDLHLQEAANYPDGPQAIVGLETMMSLREPLVDLTHPDAYNYARGVTDRTSLSFFSDRAAALVYDPKRLRVLARATHGEPDTRGALGGLMTIDFTGKEVEGYSGLLRRNGRGVVAHIPDPKPDQAVYMNDLGTTRLFLTLLRSLADKFKVQYGERMGEPFDPSRVEHVMAHHPSFQIHNHLREKLLGFSQSVMPWCREHVNAPACTFGMEMARVLPNLQVGDRILQVFFGAGATGQILLTEIV
ncbi:MAG: hypothetical protein A2785_02980 [Candidatus Chisholmbacteria bacterium RIFCSPHIGHO2_01_FULL_49_18]|uniref:Beta-ketoacyl-[acyl-carrier-protein] synthase III C-terminal domain-containing protein n=2 Tax=Candidatus Chisholmiibacteriota TaxID=1817900 RepID=A0A1G1VMA1_9BACT|nr:MAG: hypothetical protein A2785_02980 [Candidatus Chisholmbacteria bacterium RIFCSPHIGHO2_01_FULL_49_18]OGY21009.1 MAG: hypothetical protein A3A65_01720 [Candidatus Chisholmbacteria bacterium RIFCSPLOWO2_01_FULL_49_14]